jgi:drug/metabolite transporter (DMT)-like permease
MTRLLGIALVTVSAVAFGTLAAFGRYATADGLDALTILFLRFSLAAMVMAVLQAVRGEPLPRGPALLRLAGMGALGYVGQAFCYFTALNYASTGLVALLLYLYPIFVMLLSAFVLRERITAMKWVALALALVGTGLTVGPGGGQWQGIALAITAALIYSVYILVGTGVMKEVSAVQSSTIIFASAGAMSGVLMWLRGPHFPQTGNGWLAIAAIVIVATVLPVVTFLAGLERIGPSNASMLSTVEPVVTVLLGAWLFHEQLQAVSLIGGALILLAVVLLTRSELRRTERPPLPAGEGVATNVARGEREPQREMA